MVFSAAARASPSINGIIGFRAGWGIGNALFIATSLAVIVASASGGFAGAIVLYETALGVGIAIGPLLGGTLGEISWRGPFYGVAALMIALIATIVLVEPTPKPAHVTSLSAPLRALKHRGLLTMSLTALCYNWGYFTVLGYAPFPMNPTRSSSAWSSPAGASSWPCSPCSARRGCRPAWASPRACTRTWPRSRLWCWSLRSGRRTARC